MFLILSELVLFQSGTEAETESCFLHYYQTIGAEVLSTDHELLHLNLSCLQGDRCPGYLRELLAPRAFGLIPPDTVQEQGNLEPAGAGGKLMVISTVRNADRFLVFYKIHEQILHI